jgi:hypothetical protein
LLAVCPDFLVGLGTAFHYSIRLKGSYRMSAGQPNSSCPPSKPMLELES